MSSIKIKAVSLPVFTITLTINESEAKALANLAAYDNKAILNALTGIIGPRQMEKDLVHLATFLEGINRTISPELKWLKEIRETLEERYTQGG